MQTDVNTPRHPIRVVTARTGLTADVLRAWERRYGVVEPFRSNTGQRLYSDADIEKLKLLRRAISAGRAIRHVASLETHELVSMVRADEAEPAVEFPRKRVTPSGSSHVQHAIQSILRLDAASVHASLRRATMQLGATAVIDEVYVPLLHRIGELWQAARLTPAHEHLGSNVIRRALLTLGASFEPPANAPVLLTATTSGQTHELGALLASVTAAAHGWKYIYLGPDLPAHDIAVAAKQCNARVVGISLVYPAQYDVILREVQRLADALPAGTHLAVGGASAVTYHGLLERMGAEVFQELTSWSDRLRQLAAA